MRYLITFTLLTISLFFYKPALAQQDSISLNDVVAKANKVAEGYPIEKVYLHFDKPYYAVGDTVWFKAYLTSVLNTPSQISRIIYVDVINSKDVLVQSLTLPVKEGTASGQFALTKELYSQENYHIRAYTKWMANFDAAYFFNKTITVGDANKQVSTVVSLNQAAGNTVTASIIYRDAEGKPYADKKVNWYVSVGGYEDVAKGKGTTANDGTLTVSFVNSKNADLSKANLHASLAIGGGKEDYNQDIPLKTISATTDVQFFPEGGNMVNNVPGRVAMKAIKPDGLSIGFTADIVDGEGNKLTTCSSAHAGMGSFELTPVSGKTYKAIVTFTDGSKETYQLPRVKSTGFVLSANNLTDTSRIFIRLTADSSYLKANKGKSYYIVGKSGQIVCYAAKTTLNDATTSAALPASKFPTGIVQITLLNNNGLPVSERLVFVKHNNNLTLGLTTDKTVYPNRQKVKLGISAKNNITAAEGDLSLTIVDETKVPYDENAETTILTSLLLTSDLRGYIENPNYYFRSANKDAAANLDLLLLTQGYRRFTYTEMTKNRLPQIDFFPEQGITITGTLRQLNGVPVKDGGVTLQIPDKYYTTSTKTNSEGKFAFINLAFADSAKVIISAKNNYNAKNLMLMIDGMSYPALSKNPNYPDERLNIDTIMPKYLANSKEVLKSSRMLQEVVIKGKAIKKQGPSHADYPALAGLSSIDGRVISGDMLKGCANIFLCLQGMAPGVTYDSNTAAFYVSRDYNAGKRIPMAIYVNGMPVDVNYLSSIVSNDVESVEVFLRDALGLVNNINQTNGVLVINKKTPPKGTKISLQELEELIPQPNLAKLTPKGYDFPKVFYSPKYTVAGGSFGPDLRTTIYWNPKVVTDATGKASVEFFTGDNKGTYKAIVEGFDKNGHIGRTVYRFKVQ
ncbi:carboxypeptidase regulatory-like domain-containing protein [Mucilaginibacter limnophilus]|uniref:Carboxypeptidase regulatory-like domain-containing protein n=1 Tax=Mucilaginibacter limnophilus TaxID=1932778 RepID=A0A437MT28_9SPHI|nr:carboxypeptidase regulatory-like domain-containing protein [Mucilaginibacter limnophilus]RVU00792.1 carboxypeptidase regulatory-like domain-containing protein [Mucilaginibacter limnophilus]